MKAAGLLLDVYIYMYVYTYIYVYTHTDRHAHTYIHTYDVYMAVDQNPVVVSAPSVTSLCRGRLFRTLFRRFLAAMIKHIAPRWRFVLGGLSRRGLSQNTPVCYKPMSQNGRPSLLQTLCL